MKVIISGGFDPVHIGHIDHVEKAKELAGNSELIVIVQNNENLIRKRLLLYGRRRAYENNG